MREYFYFRDPYTFIAKILNAKINCKEIYLSLQKLAVLQLLFILNSKLATMCYSHDYWFVLPQFFSHRWLFSSFVDIFWKVSQLLANYTVFKLFIVWFLRWTGSYV